MAENEVIGGIEVQIVADYSQLQEGIDAAAQVAAKGGEEIAAGLNAGAAGADALSGSTIQAGAAVDDLGEQIRGLLTGSTNLAEALAQVQADASGTASGMEAATSATEAYAAEVDKTLDSVGWWRTATEEATVSVGDLASATEVLAPAVEAAGAAAASAATGLEEAGKGGEEAAVGVGDLAEKLVALGTALAITEGLKVFGEEAAAAADNITRASISLTALTGSASQAAGEIEAIEALGISDGLSLPSVLTASTRMTAMLDAGTDIVPLLGKIADGAAVMGTGIERAADSFDRLATMGTLGIRQLMPLGLSLQSIATAMNTVSDNSEATAANVAVMFKAMDQSSRVEVLSTALDKLAGTAEKAAQATFGGQWQSLADQWEQVMQGVGQALLPVISGLVDLMKTDIVPWVKEAVDAFNAWPEPVRDVVVAVGLLAAALPPLFVLVGGFGLALSGVTTAMAALSISAAGIASTVGLLVVPAIAAAIAIFHDYNTAMAATNEAEKTLDTAFQAYIAHLATSASTAEQVATAQDKIKQALDAGAISGEAAAKALALLDTVQKGLVGSNFNDYMQSMGMHFTVVTAATQNLINPTEALQIKMKSLADTVQSTGQTLADAEASYDGSATSAAKVAAAYDAWQAATKALQGSQEALVPVVSSLYDHLKPLVDMTQFYVTAVQAADNAEKARLTGVAELSTTLDHANEQLAYALSLNDSYAGKAALVSSALKDATAAQAAYDAAMDPPKLASYTQGLDAAATAMKNLVAPTQQLGPYVLQAADYMKTLGLQESSTGEITTKLIAAYQGFTTVNTSLDAQNAAWGKISASLTKLGTSDLPLVLSLYDQQYNKLVALGAPEGQLLALQAQKLQAEIDLDSETGKSATDQILGLQKIQLQQQALTDQSQLWGKTVAGVENDIIGGLENIGSSISTVIVEGGSLGDAFVKVGQKILETILNTIINAGMKELIDVIVGTGAPIASMGTTMAAAATAMQTSMTVALTAIQAQVHALTASFTELGSTITGVVGTSGTAGTAASGATGALGSAASGIMGLVGDVSDLISAVAGIVNDIQNVKIEKTLSLIEVSTRFLQIQAQQFFQVDSWKMHDDYLDKFDMVYTRLGDIWNTIGLGFAALIGAVAAGGVGIGTGGQSDGSGLGLTAPGVTYSPSPTNSAPDSSTTVSEGTATGLNTATTSAASTVTSAATTSAVSAATATETASANPTSAYAVPAVQYEFNGQWYASLADAYAAAASLNPDTEHSAYPIPVVQYSVNGEGPYNSLSDAYAAAARLNPETAHSAYTVPLPEYEVNGEIYSSLTDAYAAAARLNPRTDHTLSADQMSAAQAYMAANPDMANGSRNGNVTIAPMAGSQQDQLNNLNGYLAAFGSSMLPNSPGPAPAPISASDSTGGNSGPMSVSFTVNAASDPRETARQIANTLKLVSPRFAFGAS